MLMMTMMMMMMIILLRNVLLLWFFLAPKRLLPFFPVFSLHRSNILWVFLFFSSPLLLNLELFLYLFVSNLNYIYPYYCRPISSIVTNISCQHHHFVYFVISIFLDFHGERLSFACFMMFIIVHFPPRMRS
jgi:hypothetical protein